MKWWHYLICAVLIVVGIFSSIELIEIFNVSSKEYGTAITIETKNDYEEISKFDFGSLSFDTEDYVNYTNVSTYAPIAFDGSNEDYLILFNGQPANNIVLNSGKISGSVSIAFYDLNGDVVSVADLNVIVEYYASGTKVTLSIENVNNSVSYLTTYTNINGAVLKVVKRG